ELLNRQRVSGTNDKTCYEQKRCTNHRHSPLTSDCCYKKQERYNHCHSSKNLLGGNERVHVRIQGTSLKTARVVHRQVLVQPQTSPLQEQIHGRKDSNLNACCF